MIIHKMPKLSLDDKGSLLVEYGHFEWEPGDVSVCEEVQAWALEEPNQTLPLTQHSRGQGGRMSDVAIDESRCVLCHGTKPNPDWVGNQTTSPDGFSVEMWLCPSEFHAPWPEDCRVYWGSHGCRLQRGHDGFHECDCCDCLDHDRDHDERGCVARAPFYGPQTSFYGEDATRD